MHSRDYYVRELSKTYADSVCHRNCLYTHFDAAVSEIEITTKSNYEVFVLPESWRQLSTNFSPFRLVQYFVKRVLELKPFRIVIEVLCGSTADLARISAAFGIETVLRVDDFRVLETQDSIQNRWNAGLLACVDYIVASDSETLKAITRNFPQFTHKVVNVLPVETPRQNVHFGSFGYEAYAFGMRDHALLTRMQSGHTDFFRDCKSVLDVGCGTGVFLDCLHRQRVNATGVERNFQSAQFAKSLGLDVTVQDALTFLEQQHDCYDGIYCSHFVEHLPFDEVERLILLIAQTLAPGGNAVFVFPDPESIRTQLLGFWRDPEHVRLYHPEIVEALANVHGLDLIHNSQQIPGRLVGSFALTPPVYPDSQNDLPNGLWKRLLTVLGIAHVSELKYERNRRAHLESTIDTLWRANQTWAWEDNVTLHFRKIQHD